ncbi:hypothetical protein RCL1_008336 [Eukaryota sp. TZLM3-RCL]
MQVAILFVVAFAFACAIQLPERYVFSFKDVQQATDCIIKVDNTMDGNGRATLSFVDEIQDTTAFWTDISLESSLMEVVMQVQRRTFCYSSKSAFPLANSNLNNYENQGEIEFQGKQVSVYVNKEAASGSEVLYFDSNNGFLVAMGKFDDEGEIVMDAIVTEFTIVDSFDRSELVRPQDVVCSPMSSYLQNFM